MDTIKAEQDAYYYAHHPKRILLKYNNIDEAIELGFIDDEHIEYDVVDVEAPETIIGNITGDHISGNYSNKIIKINPSHGGDQFTNFHEHLHWQRVGNPPYELKDYYDYKVDEALDVLHERNVLSRPCELVIHGLTAGKRLGILPFSEYPGNLEVHKILPELYELDGWTLSLKHESSRDLRNIWKILSGNYLY